MSIKHSYRLAQLCHLPSVTIAHFASKMLKPSILNEINNGTVRKGTRTPIKYSFNPDNYIQMKAKGFRLEF